MSPNPRPLRRSLAPVIVGFDRETLEHLAATARERDAPKWIDSLGLAEELADVLERGHMPGLGLYRRHLPPKPPLPPPTPSRPATYRKVLLAMVAAGWPRRVVAEAVAGLALSDGLDERMVETIICETIKEAA